MRAESCSHEPALREFVTAMFVEVDVDAYLRIAEQVLRAIRRPMSAKGMLEAAYQASIVPSHLYGRTQEKTLQARLSEHILKYKQSGRFFRTGPGVFFLTELESDPTIPDEFKDHFSARRRTRDLFRAPALGFRRSFLESNFRGRHDDWRRFLRDAADADAIKYIEPIHSYPDYMPAWTFSIVRRGSSLLSYCIGRYRDDRDTFASKRTVGFPAMLSYFDLTLFSGPDMGASSCGLRTLLVDLDLSVNAFAGAKLDAPTILFALLASDAHETSLLFVMDWPCPPWFEPTKRRLSLNNTRWVDLRNPANSIDEFEPWSIAALQQLQLATGGR
jgi:hypothetical protein